MTSADGSEKRRRTEHLKASPASKGGIHRPSDIYARWDEITEQVMSRFVSIGREKGDFQAGIDQTAFARLVDTVCDQNPHWGIAPAHRGQLVLHLRNEFFGHGPLAPWMELEGLEEIMCNRYDRVFCIVHGRKQRIEPSPFRSEKDVRDFLNRTFAAQGRELTMSNPMEDGHLPDGSRIHAEIPPMAVLGACFAIRKFNPRPFTMQQYLDTGMFTEEFLADLTGWIGTNQNIVVSGGTASGKTSWLNAVGSLIPKEDRLIVIENTKELQIETEDTLYIQAIMKGAHEGAGERSITIRDAVRGALRLTPDRIIVGEVRSREALDLLQALNTGHDGSWTTIHSNSSVDAISRLESLAIMADELPIDAIQDLIARAVDIVVQVGRFRDTPYRKVLEAWQVVHPHQVDSAGRAMLSEIKARGELQQVRSRLFMLPLYTMDDDGTLIRRNGIVPVMGKSRRATSQPAAAATA